MKTSVIEVHDMLSVLSVDEVEKRIGKVPGVESVTVNFAAGSAAVRYDETRLVIAEIKASVRQSGYQSAASAPTSAGDGHEGDAAPDAPPATRRGQPGNLSAQVQGGGETMPTAPKSPPHAAAAPSAPAGDKEKDKATS